MSVATDLAMAPELEDAGYVAVAKALRRCTFTPGCWDKRFARAMSAIADEDFDRRFSERQRANLIRLAHKYRRQLATEVIVLAQDLAEAAALKQGARS
jgi:hypothetical protein